MEIYRKNWEIHGKYFGNTRKRRRKFQLHTPLLNREKDIKKKVRIGHYSIIDLLRTVEIEILAVPSWNIFHF